MGPIVARHDPCARHVHRRPASSGEHHLSIVGTTVAGKSPCTADSSRAGRRTHINRARIVKLGPHLRIVTLVKCRGIRAASFRCIAVGRVLNEGHRLGSVIVQLPSRDFSRFPEEAADTLKSANYLRTVLERTRPGLLYEDERGSKQKEGDEPHDSFHFVQPSRNRTKG